MAKIYDYAYFDRAVAPYNETHLSIASAAVLYGLSVYTVFPVVRTKEGYAAFRLVSHFKRLVNSARIIGIDTFEQHWSYEEFKKAVEQTVVANQLPEKVYIRASVHVTDDLPGTRSRGLTTKLSLFVYDAIPIVPQTGAKLKTSVWRRVPDYAIPSRAKVNGAYVNSVLGKQDALDSGYDDCLFLDVSGHICELSAANIFIVRDSMLITPGANSDILEGITRKTILEIAREESIAIHERPIDLTEVYIAHEVFACGTSTNVAPIVRIDARSVGGGTLGPITKRIGERMARIMRGEDSLSERYLVGLS